MELSPALRIAAERIERFKRLGGVDLADVKPADVRGGVEHLKKVVFTYRCPMCRNVVRNDQEMEPACTGPSWTDDHPMEIMERISDSD